METIQELIQKNRSELLNTNLLKQEEEWDCDAGCYVDREKILSWHTKSLKDLINAVIEDEEKAEKEENGNNCLIFWNASKEDTISKLKAIKELL
jgi:hypothetical protein